MIADFAASDPQVKQLILDVSFQTGTQHDCYYARNSSGPALHGVDPAPYLLNLDPFMDADPAFDKTDFAGNVLPQLQFDHKTWAYPLAIEPAILRYDTDQFVKAGIPLPNGGWTIGAFKDALNQLKVNSGDQPPFVLGARSMPNSGTHLLLLIAAFGGLPLDFRMDPATWRFTDPVTVDAIRQVLDFARQGYIKYTKLADTGPWTVTPIGTAAIRTDTLEMVSRLPGAAKDTESASYKMIAYPEGSLYTPVSYLVGAAYISAQAQNPEACYRWISTLAHHPELFASMPARRSLIRDPKLKAAQGSDAIAAYQYIDTILTAPRVLPFPGESVGPSMLDTVARLWLYQAFDKYVLHDDDLNKVLARAESNMQVFQGCYSTLATPTASTWNDFLPKVNSCLVQADPSMAGFFRGPNQN